MTRPIVAFLGLCLAVLWVIARSEDATSWMVWFEGATAVGVFAVVGLIPERRSALLAAACLFGLTLVLVALWMAALIDHGTPWFAWWIFTFGCIGFATALVVAFQGPIDRLRVPDVL